MLEVGGENIKTWDSSTPNNVAQNDIIKIVLQFLLIVVGCWKDQRQMPKHLTTKVVPSSKTFRGE
jgi:hypothetical protein